MEHAHLKKNELPPPLNPDHATAPQPENHSIKEFFLEPCLENLHAEQKRLDGDISKYDYRDFQILLNPEDVSDSIFEHITARWLEQVRATTDYLKPLDSLGIEVFKEQLECQPAFPDHSITFASKTVEQKTLVDASRVAGLADRLSPAIEIKSPKPRLREQIFYLISQGHVGESVGTMVHELIHQHHFQTNAQIDGILTEAQAYFSGIYGNPKNFDVKKIAEVLTRKSDEKQAALYEFDSKKTERVLEQVAALYGAGYSYAEVSEILTASSYDLATGCFQPLTTEVERFKSVQNLNESDTEKLHEIYQVHAYNENARARLSLFQTIEKIIPLEKLRELRLEKLRGKLLKPSFFKDGKLFLYSDQFHQRVVCPIDTKYPYDPDGKRTGIAFGFFEVEGQEQPVFRIGTWEATKTEARMKYPEDDVLEPEYEREQLIDDLRQQVSKIPLENKKDLVLEYAAKTLYENPLIRAIVRTVISPGEWRQVIQEILPDFKEKTETLVAALQRLAKKSQTRTQLRRNTYGIVDVSNHSLDAKAYHEDIRKLQSYRHFVDSLQTIFDYAGDKAEDYDQEFAQKFRQLGFELSTLLGPS